MVLSNASAGGVRLLPQGGVEYRVAGPQPTVYATTKFRAGRLTRLVPGPSLSDHGAQDALVARARSETAAVYGTVAFNRVLFAERKLTGSFAWQDKFRIYPCIEGSPVGTGLNWFAGSMDESPDEPPYPFMLQVNIEKSPNPFVQSNRTLRELDTYQRHQKKPAELAARFTADDLASRADAAPKLDQTRRTHKSSSITAR